MNSAVQAVRKRIGARPLQVHCRLRLDYGPLIPCIRCGCWVASVGDGKQMCAHYAIRGSHLSVAFYNLRSLEEAMYRGGPQGGLHARFLNAGPCLMICSVSSSDARLCWKEASNVW